MDKESTLKIAQVLHDTRLALTSVAAERDEYKAKCAAYELRQEATKVASMMHDKGLELDTDLPDLVERLEKEAAAGRLSVIEKAAEMIGPNMSFGTANHDGATGHGGDAFTQFVIGNVG